MRRGSFLKALLALPFVPGVLAKLKSSGYSAELSYMNADELVAAIMHPRIRYGLCPGWVPQKPGVQPPFYVDYVDAPTLARLYGVPMEECVVFTTVLEDSVRWDVAERIRFAPYEGNERGLILLRPRADGVYARLIPRPA